MTTPPRAIRSPRPFTSRLHLAAALAVVAVAAASTPSAGHAVEPSTLSMAQCASNRICVWSATFYGGSFASTSNTVATTVGGFSTARSVWNNSTRAAYVYSGSGGSGSSLCLAPGISTASTTLASGSIRLSTSPFC